MILVDWTSNKSQQSTSFTIWNWSARPAGAIFGGCWAQGEVHHGGFQQGQTYDPGFQQGQKVCK